MHGALFAAENPRRVPVATVGFGQKGASQAGQPTGIGSRARLRSRRRGSTKTFALLAVHHADIADDSPRLRYALECWTGLNRAATRRWLRGEATRE